jgi:pre-rRNA-processing protein TSR3
MRANSSQEKGPTSTQRTSFHNSCGETLHKGSVHPILAPVAAKPQLPKLLVYDFRQDDPKKCTSAKLRKSRLVQSLSNLRRIPSSAAVLNPTSSKTLSCEDREIIQRNGLVALDCSWNLSENIFDRNIPGNNRRLPILLAGNPTNYGIAGRLSTAEALAAALILTGFRELGEVILSQFKWGETFLSLNQDPLESYASAKPSEISLLEEEFFGSR